jgi:transporter family protein
MNFEAARSLAIALLCLLLIPFINLNIEGRVIALVYVVSLLATAAILFMSKGMRHEAISLVIPLGNIKPAFVAILAFVFLGESITIIQIIGMVILLISAYLLESDHHFSDFVQPIKHLISDKYSLFFIFAIFIFSITAIFDKYIITNHLDMFSYFFLIWMFIAVNFNIIHAFLYGFQETIDCFKQIKFLPFLVGGFSMAGNLFALKALSMAYVSLVTPVLMLAALFIVLLGGEYFHEQYRYFRLGVSFLMLIGAYLIII